ncbi:hypothetical protein, partial [Bradyrhizobium sp. cf659]|uniref:hypothetical protein n=1 Tax=Bradyrhizobium sp. cf659 TaxID=1761771 RepID=UPI001AECCC53
IVALNRPVVAIVAHRIVLQRSDPISELVNMHNCERSDLSAEALAKAEAIQSLSAEGFWIASLRSQ